jgi:GR25 family glycosyltransferase involved in LPS biosynthesis
MLTPRIIFFLFIVLYLFKFNKKSRYLSEISHEISHEIVKYNLSHNFQNDGNDYIVDIKDFFHRDIKTYYINLKDRVDRDLKIKKQLNKYNITNYERFFAIKPNKNLIKNCNFIEINKLWIKNNKKLNFNNDIDFNYIQGATGCKLSHYNIMKKFYKEDKYKYLLILEDDCIFDENTRENVNKSLSFIEYLNIKFNMLYLSTNIFKKEACQKISNCLLKINKGYGNCTHAIIFSRNTINDIIEIIEKSNNEIDCVYKNIDNRYCVHPMTSYQGCSKSNIGFYMEDEIYINENNELFYGEINKKFNYSNDISKGIKYLIYKPKNTIYNKLYDFLKNSLYICETNNINNYNNEIIYIIFDDCVDYIPKGINFIFVQYGYYNSEIVLESNLKHLINFDLKCCESDKNSVYCNGTKESIISCLISTDIISSHNVIMELNINKLYVINLPSSIKRKKNFIQNNRKIKFQFITAFKYNPRWIGCSITYYSVIQNAKRMNLEYIKICEDDCKIINMDIIDYALNVLIDSKKHFELLSCFIVTFEGEVIIEDIIILNENYKLIKINKWCSTVFNIYHKNAYKYFDNYDYKKIKKEISFASKNEKDIISKYSIDRFLNFNSIWVIFPYPVDIMEEKSEIWDDKDVFIRYQRQKKETSNIIDQKIKNYESILREYRKN